MPSPKTWNIGDQRQLEHHFQASDLDQFVKLCGDDNPIHMDKSWAEKSLAGGRVVHGMLSASFISTLIGTQIPGTGALWNRFEVNWRKMLRIGDHVIFKATVSEFQQDMMKLDIEARRDDELVLEAKATVLLMGQTPQQSPSEPLEAQRISSNEEKLTKSQPSEVTSTEHQNYILVTGASGGIGKSFVQHWASLKRQEKLVLWGRNPESLRHELNALKLDTSDIVFESVDLLQEETVQKALQSWPETSHCAGVVHLAAAPWKATPCDSALVLEESRKHLKVSFESLVQICTTLRPHMIQGCSIVALSTQYAIEAPPENNAAYISGKLALEGYIRSIAVELGQHGIRANLISPSMVNTPYTQDVPVRKKMVEGARNPMRRLCEAQDVAQQIAWLLSKEASFINGTNIPLTGGLTI